MMNDFKQMNSSLGCTVDYKPRQSGQTTHLLTKVWPLVAAETNFGAPAATVSVQTTIFLDSDWY